MDFASSEKEVIDLLSKLKNLNGPYPPEIFTARRQDYLRQVANMGLGVGVSTAVKNATKGGNGTAGTVTTVISKILEIALITAIAIEAGTVAYFYRDKLAELVRTYMGLPNVQEVTSPIGEEAPSTSASIGVNIETPTVVTFSTPSGTAITTVTVITSGTPTPEVARDTSNSSNKNDSTTNTNATPKPKGNNGNQYGLTPKPERTKDNNGGSNNNDGGNHKKP